MSDWLRGVDLPDGIPGSLFLGSMPGRDLPWAQALEALETAAIDTLVNLAERREIDKRSPEYAALLAARTTPWEQLSLPIPATGVPDDPQDLLDLADAVAARLRHGRRVLIHCAFGIGRTGTLAVLVLWCLGATADAARMAVARAGSGAESPFQERLLQQLARNPRQRR